VALISPLFAASNNNEAAYFLKLGTQK